MYVGGSSHVFYQPLDCGVMMCVANEPFEVEDQSRDHLRLSRSPLFTEVLSEVPTPAAVDDKIVQAQDSSTLNPNDNPQNPTETPAAPTSRANRAQETV